MKTMIQLKRRSLIRNEHLPQKPFKNDVHSSHDQNNTSNPFHANAKKSTPDIVSLVPVFPGLEKTVPCMKQFTIPESL